MRKMCVSVHTRVQDCVCALCAVVVRVSVSVCVACAYERDAGNRESAVSSPSERPRASSCVLSDERWCALSKSLHKCAVAVVSYTVDAFVFFRMHMCAQHMVCARENLYVARSRRRYGA